MSWASYHTRYIYTSTGTNTYRTETHMELRGGVAADTLCRASRSMAQNTFGLEESMGNVDSQTESWRFSSHSQISVCFSLAFDSTRFRGPLPHYSPALLGSPICHSSCHSKYRKIPELERYVRSLNAESSSFPKTITYAWLFSLWISC